MLINVKSRLIKLFCILVLSLIIDQNNKLYSQIVINTTGLPIVHSFSREDFNGGAQTWSITQNDQGIMYFANNDGVLEFDGETWGKFPMKNHSIVREVYFSEDGRLYVGSYNDVGFYSYNESHQLYYQSLTHNLHPEFKDFGEVWSIHDRGDQLVAQSFLSTFIIENDTIQPLYTNCDLNYSFVQNDLLFCGDNKDGLKVHDGESIKIYEAFAGKTVTGVEQLNENCYLIGTSFDGFFILKDQMLRRWDQPISTFVKQNHLYCTLKLHDNLYAGGTINNGVVFFNDTGEIIRIINTDSGLQNNSVLSMYLDRDNNLWLGLDSGIDMMSLASPISKLFSRNQVGTGYVSKQYEEDVYFGSNRGLFVTHQNNIINTNSDVLISEIEGLNGQVWNLQIIENKLLCSHHNGLYLIENHQAIPIFNHVGYWELQKIDQNIFVASTYKGIEIIEYKPDEFPYFFERPLFSEFQESCRCLKIDSQNDIWLSQFYKGVYRLELNENLDSIQKVTLFDDSNKLTTNYQNIVEIINNDLTIFSGGNVLQYIEEEDRFAPSKDLQKLVGENDVLQICKDECKNLWVFFDDHVSIIRSNFSGQFNIEELPFAEIQNGLMPLFGRVTCIDGESLIMNNEDGFLFFDKSMLVKTNGEHNLLLRYIKNKKGEVIYQSCPNHSKITPLELDFTNNYLSIHCSALNYIQSEEVDYLFWLEGYENTWTDPQKSPTTIYAGLKPGQYTMHLKSRNNYGDFSDTLKFDIIIYPPWYQSQTAIWTYMFLALLICYFIWRIFKYRLQVAKIKLHLKSVEESEKIQKALEYDNLMKEKEIERLRNENLQIENVNHLVNIENKTKELAAIAMKISSINEVVSRTKDRLVKVQQSVVNDSAFTQIGSLVRNLELELKQQDNWKQFEIHFDQVHENFLHAFRNAYPELTAKDLKMAAYIRMNFSTKEIAQLFNMTIRGVETARFRLRRKIDLEQKENLSDFIIRFSEHSDNN